MAGLLLGPRFAGAHDARIAEVERESGASFERILLPDSPDERLAEADIARVELAFFSGDVFPDSSRAFFSAVQGAQRLRWLHLFNTGTDHPVFQRFIARGVTVRLERVSEEMGGFDRVCLVGDRIAGHESPDARAADSIHRTGSEDRVHDDGVHGFDSGRVECVGGRGQRGTRTSEQTTPEDDYRGSRPGDGRRRHLL